MFYYQINPDSETPIYRQLVEQINARIRSGALACGTQLPTVRQMAEKLHLSCGTVKHVYDCLQEMGVIEMTRRRGTFVTYVRKEEESRKHQAMHAIDHMIRTLMELNFSPAEIQIFLNLKMRQWGLRWSGIRITVVTEYTEMAAALEKQLEQIGNVRVSVCPPGRMREYPHSIDEQSDVILLSSGDGQSLSHLISEGGKVIRVAFQTDTASVVALGACPAGTVGVLCEGEAFYKLILQHVGKRTQAVRITSPEDAMQGLDALIIARGYQEKLDESVQSQILRFERLHPVIRPAYLLDEGSMLYLEERINKIRDERQHWPGMLRP